MSTLNFLIILTFISTPVWAQNDKPVCPPEVANQLLARLMGYEAPAAQEGTIGSAGASVREMLDENFRRIRAEKIQMSTPERVEAAALSGSIDVLSQDPAFLRQGFKYADVEYMAKRLGLDRAVAVSQLTGARSPMQDSRDALLKMISHLKENPGNVNALKLEKWTGNPTAVRQILQKNIYEYRQVGNDQ